MSESKAYYEKALATNTLPHALLLVGGDETVLLKTGFDLACRILQSPLERIEREGHPDFYLLSPETQNGFYSIEALKGWIHKAYTTSFEGKGKVFLLKRGDRMQPVAANALLKTIEEPPLQTYFIFLSPSGTQSILPTILSRMAILSFEGEEKSISLEKPQISLLFSLISGTLTPFERAEAIEKIAFWVENEEDPILREKKKEKLFLTLAEGYRDRCYHRFGGKGSAFLFPEKIDVPLLFPLSKVLQILEESRLAYERNLKLSSCLTHLFYAMEMAGDR